MANRHRQAARSSTTERICPVCQGSGEETLNSSRHGDPQCEYSVPCSNPDCDAGWVRWAPVDPLEVMHSLRRRRSWPPFGLRYGDAFARAVTDVSLPADRPRINLRNAA